PRFRRIDTFDHGPPRATAWTEINPRGLVRPADGGESRLSHRRKRLTGSSGWPRHGLEPGDGTRVSPEARGPLRLHPREPRWDRQCPWDYPGLVGRDPRRSDHFGRDPRCARSGVDRHGGRRLHLDPGPTAALLEPGRPGAAGDAGSAANGT